jgi:hemin uptake protein HemP
MAATRENNAGDDGADDRDSSDARPVVVRGNRIDSGELFAADKEIIITHGADVYRLRLTSQNKLILTK